MHTSLYNRSLRPSLVQSSVPLRRSGCRSRGLSYKDAGVDIDAGNELVNRIKKLNPAIGGFSGMVPFADSFLVAGTDGVGTKLKLAFDMQKHDTVGIDLVAMSVNDIITSGAQPMFFLDYFATGKLDVDIAEQVSVNQLSLDSGKRSIKNGAVIFHHLRKFSESQEKLIQCLSRKIFPL